MLSGASRLLYSPGHLPHQILMSKAKSETVSLHTLTKLWNLDLVDLFFRAIRSRKCKLVLSTELITSIWRGAKYDGQFTLSTHLTILNYPVVLFHRRSTTVSQVRNLTPLHLKVNCLPLRPSYLRIQQFNYSRESWHFQFKFPTLARQDSTVPFPWVAREGDVEASNWSAQKKLHCFQARGRGQGWKLCIALTPLIAAMALALTRYSRLSPSLARYTRP